MLNLSVTYFDPHLQRNAIVQDLVEHAFSLIFYERFAKFYIYFPYLRVMISYYHRGIHMDKQIPTRCLLSYFEMQGYQIGN